MLAVVALLVASPSPAESVVIQGYRPSAEASVSSAAMRYLPFEVPKGVVGLTIRKELDHGDTSAPRIVDHGLFDPRGIGPGGPGFRGWMGGHPADIVVTSDPATTGPWFLAGPIPAGRWHLAQYYLQGTPNGLRYRYTITFTRGVPRRSPAQPAYRPGRLAQGPAWFAGNLHSHSIHSDGGHDLAEVARLNVEAGYQFVAATEHNTTSGHWALAKAARNDLLWLVGTEITTPSGHLNAIGHRPGHWFDFRLDAGDGKLPQLVAEAKRQGAMVMANHPFAPCTTCPFRFSDTESRGLDGVEVWNGAWDATDERAVQWWDGRLRKGERLHAYGGTDFHRVPNPLTPVCWTYAASLDRDAILSALRRGRTVLGVGPKATRLVLEVDGKGAGESVAPGIRHVVARLEGPAPTVSTRLQILHRRGRMTEARPGDGGTDFRTNLEAGDFVRAELRAGDGRMLALTNAVFVSR